MTRVRDTQPDWRSTPIGAIHFDDDDCVEGSMSPNDAGPPGGPAHDQADSLSKIGAGVIVALIGLLAATQPAAPVVAQYLQYL